MEKPNYFQRAKKEFRKYNAYLMPVLNKFEDLDEIIDGCSRIADGSVPFLIYYEDTIPLFLKFKRQIIELLDIARLYGSYSNAVDMIRQFNCLQGFEFYDSDLFTLFTCTNKNQIFDKDLKILANALTWFLFEETARRFIDIYDSID